MKEEWWLRGKLPVVVVENVFNGTNKSIIISTGNRGGPLSWFLFYTKYCTHIINSTKFRYEEIDRKVIVEVSTKQPITEKDDKDTARQKLRSLAFNTAIQRTRCAHNCILYS